MRRSVFRWRPRMLLLLGPAGKPRHTGLSFSWLGVEVILVRPGVREARPILPEVHR